MDKIQKALQKFGNSELKLIKSILLKLEQGNLQGFDIVKLKGHANIFRIRHGKLRIIFSTENNEVKILAIERRTEKTYRNF